MSKCVRGMAGWLVVMSVVVMAKQKGNVWPDTGAFNGTLKDRFSNPGQRVLGLPGVPVQLLHNQREWSWNNALGVYLPSTNVSIVDNAQCRSDVEAFLKVVTDDKLLAIITALGQTWPLTLADSWGKVPDGLLFGNLMTWGVMEECTHLLANTTLKPLLDVHFRGRYCLVQHRKQASSQRTNGMTKQPQVVVQGGQHDVRGHLTRMGSLLALSSSPSFSYGTCMPSSCTPTDLLVSIEAVVGGSSGVTIDCHTKDEVRWLNAGDIVFIVFLGILGSILFLATIADISSAFFHKQELRKGPLRFLLVFSVYTNLTKIFHINMKEGPHVISCLHGIRVMSMIWVVWGHTYYVDIIASVNLVYATELTDNVVEQTIMGGNFSVDTFFLMSGLLVMSGVLREFSKAKRINWVKYYVYRYVRLTPPILLTGAATATIARFALVGPYAGQIERSIVETCREYWWHDVLYISNLPNIMKLCLPQCWYVCVDIQLYLVAPLVILPLLYRPKIGAIWMGVVSILAVLIPMIILGVYSLPGNLVFDHPVAEPKAYVDTYGKPWCRAAVYLLGMWGGVFIHHYKDRPLRLKMWQAAVGWVVAATLALLVVYGIADYNTLVDYKPIPQGIGITYEVLSRVAWGIAVLWVIIACHKGYGGPVNSFLAHPSWQPLSRLTFTMYLVAFIVQCLYIGAVYTPMYMNHLNQFIQTCGMLFVTGILAVIISLISEGPVLGLVKLILGS